MAVPGFVGLPAYCLYRWAWAVLDLLYPPQCGGCGKKGTRWCPSCAGSSIIISNNICQQCGQVLAYPGLCTRCQTVPPSFTNLRSWALFTGPLREALHRLKYQGDIALGEILARPLIGQLKTTGWKVDLVAPVPMGAFRLSKRGYNQAALLARPVAMGCGLTYRPDALAKIRETRSQVGLSYVQRLENVAGAFDAISRIVSGKNVLIVDDVTTSGATLDACARALKRAGANQVFGLTLARAVRADADPIV